VTVTADSRVTPAMLLSRADRHLYAAKHAGRDRVVADAG
jgi:PleD family two-component response regulator